METKNISNANFRGAFLLKPQTPQVREAIPDIVKKGRQIFRDIKSDGDVVLVTKDKFDSRIGKFIETEGLQFEYYPEISTKSGLDDQKPLGLKNLLKEKK